MVDEPVNGTSRVIGRTETYSDVRGAQLVVKKKDSKMENFCKLESCFFTVF